MRYSSLAILVLLAWTPIMPAQSPVTSAGESAAGSDETTPKDPTPKPAAEPNASDKTAITPFIAKTWLPMEESAFVAPRLTLRRDFGDGPGFNNGFTYLEGFIPLWQPSQQSIVFGNLRVVNFDTAEQWEFNVGLGARRYNSYTDRILGAYVNYDGRTTVNRNYFNQMTAGFESLGCRLDFRANVYLPVGLQRRQIAEGLSNPRFAGFNILFDRTQVSEVALRGLDAEVGTPIPPFGKWDARAFVGYYHYSNSGLQGVNGVRGRMEANVSDRITFHLAVQNDAVSDTTVYGGLAIHMGPGRRTRSGVGRGVVDRLGDRIVRDPNIFVSNQVSVTPELALDIHTGTPIIVRHANSNAPAGGDGTVERPVQTLAQLQATSTPKDILFLHANSTFTQPEMTLKNGQRLLGEGIDHYFSSLQGTFLLPRATSGSISPLLLRTSGDTNAVNLAMDNEVSGLRYQRSGGGLGGFIGGADNLGTFNINRNTTTGGETAIDFLSVAGNGVIQKNAFGPHIEAIRVNQTANTNLTLVIKDNQFNGGITGIYYFQNAGNAIVGIRNNRFTSLGSVLDAVAGGVETLQLRDNIGTGAYQLDRVGGIFRIEDLLGTNTPTPTTFGAVTIIPAGSGGVP